MKQWKSWLSRGIDLALGLLGLCMIYEGLIYFINTRGYVTGSEFGMLISIVNPDFDTSSPSPPRKPA